MERSISSKIREFTGLNIHLGNIFFKRWWGAWDFDAIFIFSVLSISFKPKKIIYLKNILIPHVFNYLKISAKF